MRSRWEVSQRGPGGPVRVCTERAHSAFPAVPLRYAPAVWLWQGPASLIYFRSKQTISSIGNVTENNVINCPVPTTRLGQVFMFCPNFVSEFVFILRKKTADLIRGPSGAAGPTAFLPGRPRPAPAAPPRPCEMWPSPLIPAHSETHAPLHGSSSAVRAVSWTETERTVQPLFLACSVSLCCAAPSLLLAVWPSTSRPRQRPVRPPSFSAVAWARSVMLCLGSPMSLHDRRCPCLPVLSGTSGSFQEWVAEFRGGIILQDVSRGCGALCRGLHTCLPAAPPPVAC